MDVSGVEESRLNTSPDATLFRGKKSTWRRSGLSYDLELQSIGASDMHSKSVHQRMYITTWL
jgi:hypothetical protein